ncbi:pyroglutamyl-peptidase [Granulicatella balaenopterae]|uniref:Pyroglutamyl-peptidase I n=2 Tax=Granulicatella balaenopterae TaxID=137733 RepID=A0A1H9JIZ6_9LACT|nr:pyroglutamyl-peptidase [Granulicatella balaenopterae]
MVTAFDAFGGESVNPALEVVNLLPNELLAHRIVKVVLPTVFQKSRTVLMEAVRRENPDVLLSVGQAGGVSAIRVERVAINIDDARMPDNEGQEPIDCVIEENGAPAYFSNLPIKRMVSDLEARGIPAQVSNSAGTFVCNHVMYQGLFLADQEFPEMLAGFVHLPYLPKQVVSRPTLPSMSKELMVEALMQLLVTIIENTGQKDVILSGGSLF